MTWPPCSMYVHTTVLPLTANCSCWCGRHRKRCHDVQMHALHGNMQVIDLGDTMDFDELPVGSEDVLTCNIADIPTDESNLVIKVIMLWRFLCQLHRRGSCPALPSQGLHKQHAHAATDAWLDAMICSSLQAFRLFRERTGSQQHYRVHLEKRVPHGDAQRMQDPSPAPSATLVFCLPCLT